MFYKAYNIYFSLNKSHINLRMVLKQNCYHVEVLHVVLQLLESK